MQISHHFGHVVGGTLLVAATTIGVGILGMPIATAPGGFIPSLATFTACWLFMLCTGLLILEVCEWMPEDANFITMTGILLGPAGRLVCWLFYLFLFLTLIIAHVAGGGNILSGLTHGSIPGWAAIIIYVLVFAPVVYLGTHSVDRINLCLMGGLGITYAALIILASRSLNFNLLAHSNWGKAWCAVPILFTAFAFQFIIPTLVSYMKRDFKKIKLALILGSAIPFVIYLIWEFTILGIVPIYGSEGLVAAGQLGDTAIEPLMYIAADPALYEIGKYFALFTMSVSFIALSISFLDFLADGLHMQKIGYKKFLLVAAIFGCPMIIALTYPDIFSIALKYAGGLSIAVLFGLLPPLMVWAGRYVKNYPKIPGALSGGRPLLAFLITLTLAEICLDLLINCT